MTRATSSSTNSKSCCRRAPSFFFNDTATTEIYTLSLHDALPISSPALLARPVDPATTPNVLAAGAALAAGEGRWTDARALAMRAVSEFPTSEAAPAALSLVGLAAARAGEWPLTNETFQLLSRRYPGYKTGRDTRLDYAEALYRTGALAEARAKLQEFIVASP